MWNSGNPPPRDLTDAPSNWSHLETNSSQITLHDHGGACHATSADDASCGWWIFRPKCLRLCLFPKWVLFWLCWAGALQGMVVNGFVNVVITTIERRFDLRSTDTGLTASAYDIASFLCLVPISYFGGSRNKPLWLGLGLIVISLGSFLFAVPHFAVAAVRILEEKNDSFCSANVTADTQSSCQQSAFTSMTLSNYKYVFIFAQLLHGAGASPLYTLGVTYLDENVPTKMSSVYVGIYYAMAIVGPAFGYVIGGQLLNVYTDIDKVDVASLGLTPTSSAWIGAWWIGFLISGVLALIISIPVLGFPKDLPGSQEIRAQKVSEAHCGTSDDSVVNQVGFGTSIKHLPKSLKILLANPAFMFLNIAGAFEAILIIIALLLSGFAAFLPKFIESQFSVSASWAALVVGGVIVSSGGGGTFLGGYLVKHFQLRCSGIIKLCVGLTFAALISCFAFLMSCPTLSFAGVNTPYYNDSLQSLVVSSLNGSCSTHCHCSLDNYDPICGIDEIVYYSPCHAGCSETIQLKDHQTAFTNCSCIKHDANSTESSDHIVATREPCQGHCDKLPIFLTITFILSLLTFLASMPALTATLRCVVEQQRSFALGIQWIIVRLLGSIPAPIIFGAIMDATCILWQNSCGHRGSCRAYDNFLMSRYILVISLVGKTLSTTCFFLAYFLYKPPLEILGTAANSTIQLDNSGAVVSGEGGNSVRPAVNGQYNNDPDVEVAHRRQHWTRVLRTSAGL